MPYSRPYCDGIATIIANTHMTRTERIAAIAALPDELERTLAELPEGALDRPYRPGGWTGRQVVHHIADSHMNAFTRFKLGLTEDRPTVKPYDQNEWARTPDVAGPVESSLAIIRGLHARWSELMGSIKDDDWSRTVLHPENGDMSLERLLEIYSLHGRKHIGHLQQLA
jgi:hypothetical protein